MGRNSVHTAWSAGKLNLNMVKRTLRLCCWNIQGIQNQQVGNKLNESEVASTFMRYDIICLLETHGDLDTNIDLKGYKSFAVCRPKFGKARKPSGGIAVLVKDEVNPGVSIIKSTHLPHDMLWLKLNKNYFRSPKDIYVGVTYLSPANSSYVQRQDIDLFGLVENEVVKYAALGDIMLMGDFNARTGNGNDYIENDRSDMFIPLPDMYIQDAPMAPRHCHDSVMNGYGRKLLELCRCTGLRLLNGRKLGDTLGRFTCHEYGGNSTIDYILSNLNLYDKVQYFKVNEWHGHLSDHCIIECGLSTEVSTTEKVKCDLTARLPRYKWYKESEYLLKETLRSGDIQNSLKGLLNNIKNRDVGVNEAVSGFNMILHQAGDRCLKKHRGTNNKRIKQKWFDRSCDVLRQIVKMSARRVSERPFDNALKIEFYSRKKEYKRLLKQKKNQYKQKILDKLENLHSTNPVEYWRLVKELQKHVGNETKHADKIAPEVWYDYFQTLLGKKSVIEEKDKNMEERVENLESGLGNVMDEEITYHEVCKVVKNLKNKKAVSIDNISNEIIKASFEVIPEVFMTLFNFVFDSGIYPSFWSSGLITALHKKGSMVIPSNYRGITICSCLAKVYSGVLNNRLYNFMCEQNILSEEQISSRKGARTVDHMFILKSLIDKCKSQKEK